MKLDDFSSSSNQGDIQYLRIKNDNDSYLYGTNEDDEFYTNAWDLSDDYYMRGAVAVFYNKFYDITDGSSYLVDFRLQGDGDKISLYQRGRV